MKDYINKNFKFPSAICALWHRICIYWNEPSYKKERLVYRQPSLVLARIPLLTL